MAVDEKLKPFIIATLRRASYRWHPRYMCKVNARVERGKYRCAICKEVVGNKDVQIDHIEPIVDPIRGFVDWQEYVTRLFCSEEKFQAVCRPCHKEKSLKENAKRREIKKAAKEAVLMKEKHNARKTPKASKPKLPKKRRSNPPPSV